MLEDRRPTPHSRLTGNALFVLLGLIIDLLGTGGRDNGYRLRQVPSDDARNVRDRFGGVIFEAHRPSHACHGEVHETVQAVLQLPEGLSRVLNGKREEHSAWEP